LLLKKLLVTCVCRLMFTLITVCLRFWVFYMCASSIC
jgi:hypothetical protein